MKDLHLTLKFFGEVASDRLDVIGEALRFAADGAEALSLRLGELGAFPSRSRPRILWVGVKGPPALELLQDRIERGSEAIGFPPEGAPFQPHVTLGRVREGQRLPAGGLEDYADGSRAGAFRSGQELVLYESVLTTSGPRYESRLTIDSRSLMGCLAAPFKLLGVIGLVAALAIGWLYRDRLGTRSCERI